MPLPKKIKKHIPLTQPKTLLSRRYELAEKIQQDGTFLPKSLLHADLDKGFLDFVKDELKTIVDGKVVPMVDILITTQNWAQFTETWNFQNLDKNAEPPFITVVRVPEVKFGTNPALMYNIPNRKQYFYAQVPTWDGNRQGFDVYKIPQPVPVDITYSVKIICNRMRELNTFNKNVIEKFASRQAYQVIKGHYIPIVMGEISDESVMELEKRKFYIQSYSFTMLGFLIDENEFEVSPAISRVLQLTETERKDVRRQKKRNSNPSSTTMNIDFPVDVDSYNKVFDYSVNINISNTVNISSYSVYINGNYFGDDVPQIQINSGDTLKVMVVKSDYYETTSMVFNNLLV
jgi:hypothetical protein